MSKQINLALQGGGAHGAFAWGVLDRLLEGDELEIAGISGTSAGALNGAAVAAGMALGTAYYYFPSKEAIISAYYETTQARHHAYVTAHLGDHKTLQGRLKMVFYSKIEDVRGDRRMLGAIFRYSGDPGHPLSVLGDETRELQRQSVATIALALRGERLPREVAEHVFVEPVVV